MISPFLGLRTLIYQVSDLNRAKAWYSHVLNTEPYFDEPFYIGFHVSGYELGLQPTENQEATMTENVSVYWGVEDIAASFQRLLNCGATAHQSPADVGGDIQVATVRDPWGNVFGIIYNPHFRLPEAKL
jgi:predicted enzyme related to lactoylglutathione lyase